MIDNKDIAKKLRDVGLNTFPSRNGAPILWSKNGEIIFKSPDDENKASWKILETRYIADEEYEKLDFDSNNGQYQVMCGGEYDPLTGKPTKNKLAGLDLDNKPAVDEACKHFKVTNLEALANTGKALIDVNPNYPESSSHVYFIVHGDIEDVELVPEGGKQNDRVPMIELMAESKSLMSLRKFIGDTDKFFNNLNSIPSDSIKQFIDHVRDTYKGEYHNGKAHKNTPRIPINTGERWRKGTRTNKLLSYGNSIYYHLLRTNPSTPVEIIDKVIEFVNTELCEPPKEQEKIKQLCKSIREFQLKKYSVPTSGTLSVLQAKRLREGTVSVIGTITSVSDQYILEIGEQPNVKLSNAKSIQIEDIETLDENERLNVVLYDDDIEHVIAGETVRITGQIKVEDKNPKKPSKKKFNTLHASSIEYLSRKEIEITKLDIEIINKFASYEKLMERLVAMFAPNIVGHEEKKRGILRAIVGGIDHGKLRSGRVDTLLVGDPGTAKSGLGLEAVELKPNSRHVSAPHATGKTITAVPEKINEMPTLVLGAIPLSRGGICAIDEINTFSMDDQGKLLDILQDGAFDFDKMGIRRRIPAPTTIIATANPTGGKWNSAQVATKDEIELKKSLMDRFTQIYTFRDNMSKEQTESFADELDDLNEGRAHNYNFLRKYLIYASSIKNVEFTKGARVVLKKFWVEGKINDLLNIRMFRGLYKIAEAHAKLQLKNVVTEEIAQEVVKDVREMMKHYGEIVGEILGPHELTYNTCLKILKDSDVGMTIEEMCRIAIHEDIQIKEYIGVIWQIKHNKKLRNVVDSLLNHPHVKKINEKPAILQFLSDPSDLCDPISKKEIQKNSELGNNITNDILETDETDSQNRSHRSHRSPSDEVDASKFIKLEGYEYGDNKISYFVDSIVADLSVQNNFIGGHFRMRGEDDGRYPTNLLQAIDEIFGSENNTIEVCSNGIAGLNKGGNCFTVDINPEHKPDLVGDGQVLEVVADNTFSRWRCDPPYNEKTAKEMYGTDLPNVNKLLKSGCRVVKPGSLLFLLHEHITNSNVQGLKKIGYITISAVPNRGVRILNIYVKLPLEEINN